MRNHYAFIVGVNQEWPEERCDLGDIGLSRCLRDHCKLPNDNLVEVYDDMATRSNVLMALDSLLDHRNENLAKKQAHTNNGESSSSSDVLLFYYGGHGKRTAFCSQKHCVVNGKLHTQPWIEHLEIINMFETKFKGGTVLCIIDTCHSGGFGEAVFQRYVDNNKSLNVNYGCIMSVPPDDNAGMEWSMSEAFIRAFKGELLCSPPGGGHGGGCYYLSTKKGKHPIKSTMGSLSVTLPNTDNNADNEHKSIIPTWGQLLEYLSDEMGTIKADRLTTLFLGKGMEDGTFLQQPCIFGDDYNTSDVCTCATASIQRDETWMDPFRRECYTVNDGVYVKCSVGCPIGWFPGRIISIGSETMQIELFDVITKLHWTVTLPSTSKCLLLAGLPFKFGFEPQSCVNVITRMAKSLGYFDTSLPRGTRVKVLWEEDGEYYKATTMSCDELVWKVVDLYSEIKVIGPCVPIRWDEDDSFSIVPTSTCIVKNTDSKGPEKSKSSKKKISLAEKSTIVEANISTPMDAMMASLACQGKKLQGDSPVLEGLATEEDANSWEAYDAESCTWESVQLMNKVDQSILPLTVLAYHMCYPGSETFSVVFWESDSSLSIVPNSCLRQKPTSNNDSDDGSSSSSSSSEEENCVKTNEHEEVRKYIEIACYKPSNNELETNFDIQRMVCE